MFLFLNSYIAFAFSFSATPTAATCTGNGSISLTISNPDLSGFIVFYVYQLPNITIPYTTVLGTAINNLPAGTYKIVARENIGSSYTEQQQQIVVSSNVIPLTYTVLSLNQACSNISNISITTITGTAVNYEIFAGPILYPLQTNNTFAGLVPGVYKIRVYDTCGVGVVQTVTVTQNTAGITIGPPVITDSNPVSCNFSIANNTITPSNGTVIGYPLDITYTIHPPGGAPLIVINSNLPSGNATSQVISTSMPIYINQSFSYDVTIIDACNTTYVNTFSVNQNFATSNTIVKLDCNQNYFYLDVTNGTAPYSLNFTSVPVGFNPVNFNVDYPGPINTNHIVFGSNANTVPLGNYSVSITDSCGRIVNKSFSIVFTPSVPVATVKNNGCLLNTGSIVISIPSFKLTSVIITVAPASFPFPLPYDVSALITATGTLTLNPVPTGNYVMQVNDNCGSILAPLSCTVPVYVDMKLTLTARPGCDLGKTSVELKSNNGKLVSVSITIAPAGFPYVLPYVIDNYIIANGKLYINDLPGGNYTFQAVDECGFNNTISSNIPGYAITTSTFSLQTNCGSFNIPLNFVSNGNTNQTFWLQKLIDPVTNTWGSPSTLTAYVNGILPTAANSLALINNGTNLNLSFNGTFRIVRCFNSFNDGVSINNGTVAGIDKLCYEELSPTMSFNQAFEILTISRIPCSSNGIPDVIILANGTAPLNYSIISKNGAPFSLNNGASNIFYNLPNGLYTFQVEDACGNVANRIFNVSDLASLVNMVQPNDMLQCKGIITGNETFDLTQQNATILGIQIPSNYTLTYYTSITDAQSAINAIPNPITFNPTTNPQTIYARLIFNPLPNCYEIRSFDLIVGQTPAINLQDSFLNCSQSPTVLDASANNMLTTTYLWSTGETTPSITIVQPGTTTINVVATNSYGVPVQTCTNTKNIEVTISEIPKIDHFETVDWTLNENSITVFTSNSGDFEYSLDNNIYQDNPSFTNLLPGVYNVYVRDKKGCGFSIKEVWLLYFKKYFTPNGDGFNEYWKIENSENEPNLKVVVYDRYGKIMSSFDATSPGWDGTYNGKEELATDYWFEVFRQDGRIHHGHFTLKR